MNSVAPMVRKVVSGHNCFLVAYGASGTGKAHTLHGTEGKDKDGILPLAIDSLFNRIAEDKDRDYMITVSMFQIRRGFIVDLLNPRPKSTLYLKNSRQLGAYVQGLAELECVKADRAKELFRQGLRVKDQLLNRTTSAGKPHIVMNLNVESMEKGNRSTTRTSILRFFQVAGSGGLSYRSNIGLQALGKCVDALAVEGDDPFAVPFAASELTRLMESGLGGNAYCLFMLFCDPREKMQADTLKTLEMGGKVGSIKNTVQVNVNNLKDLIGAIREEISTARSELNLDSASQWSHDIDQNLLERMKRLTAELERAKTRSWENRRALSQKHETQRVASLQKEGLSLALHASREVPHDLQEKAKRLLKQLVMHVDRMGAVEKEHATARNQYTTFARLAMKRAMKSSEGAAGFVKNDRLITLEKGIEEKMETLQQNKVEFSELQEEYKEVMAQIVDFEAEKRKADLMAKKMKKKRNEPQTGGDDDSKASKTLPQIDPWSSIKYAMKKDMQVRDQLEAVTKAFDNNTAQANQDYTKLMGSAPSSAHDDVESIKRKNTIRCQTLRAQAEETVKLEYERNEIWSRFLEQEFRQQARLGRLRKHMFAMFSNYRMFYQQQRDKIEGRYGELLENSVKDAFKLAEDNQRLKLLIERKEKQL